MGEVSKVRAGMTLPAVSLNRYIDAQGKVTHEDMVARERQISDNILSATPPDDGIITDSGLTVAEVRDMIATGEAPAGDGRSREGADSSAPSPDAVVSDRSAQRRVMTIAPGKVVDIDTGEELELDDPTASPDTASPAVEAQAPVPVKPAVNERMSPRSASPVPTFTPILTYDTPDKTGD